MKYQVKHGSIVRLLVATVAAGLLTGCAFHQQYRTNLESCQTSPHTDACRDAAIEDSDTSLLGFVEFDDQGWLWNRKQLDVVMDRLRQEEARQRLMIITFVHGWQHNARYDDTNVEMIRKNLRVLNRLERRSAQKEGRTARRVVGVYAGWRGRSLKTPGLDNVTFWERKNTAHEVGRGGLCELFLRLEDLRNTSRILHAGEKDQTRLIIIGHSFGGAATYSALAAILAERAIQTIDEQGRGHPPRGFGDLLMLINPAFEAARYGVLQDIAVHQTYLTSNLVNLAIFTSKTDDATKVAFPIGRHVSTLFDKYQSPFERKANRTAVGHFHPYITHDLISTTAAQTQKPKKPVEPTDHEIEQTIERVADLKAQTKRNVKQSSGNKEDFTYHFIGSDLKPREGHDPRMPLYVVAVDPKIIPDHSDIDRPPFLRFLEQFLTTFEPQER